MRGLAIFAAAAHGASDWQQLCSSTNNECRVPLEYRDPARWTPAPGDPKGHLRPLGHADFDDTWDGEVDILDEMTPETFWTKYWPRKPFVLRGAANDHAAMKRWKDDDYIIRKFGHNKVKIELKNEDRLTDYCGLEKFGETVECSDSVLPYTETFMNISRFMKRYRNPAKFDHYVITQMPADMQEEIEVVPSWNCGKRDTVERESKPLLQQSPWMTQMYEANLWINYNEGKNFSSSVIHYDMNHQMMCVYDGVKEWITWDTQSQIDHIPMWSGYYDKKTGRPQGGSDDSPIDPERVDMKKFPGFAKARWTNATMRAGDCMYLPAYHMHYVRSTGRNIAGMYMFQTTERFDPDACADAPTTGLPLSKYDILWDFPGKKGYAGYNKVKMGHPHWKKLFRAPLLKQLHSSTVDLKTLLQFGQAQGLRAELVKHKWKKAAGDSQTVPVSTIVSHEEFDDFFRWIGVTEEADGDDSQQMDVVYARTSLQSTKTERVGAEDGGQGGEGGEGDEEEEEEEDGEEERRSDEEDDDEVPRDEL